MLVSIKPIEYSTQSQIDPESVKLEMKPYPFIERSRNVDIAVIETLSKSGNVVSISKLQVNKITGEVSVVLQKMGCSEEVFEVDR